MGYMADKSFRLGDKILEDFEATTAELRKILPHIAQGEVADAALVGFLQLPRAEQIRLIQLAHTYPHAQIATGRAESEAEAIADEEAAAQAAAKARTNKPRRKREA